MPKPGWTSVTLPASLVDEARTAAEHYGTKTAEFIAHAVRRALEPAAASGSPSLQAGPMTPAPPVGSAASGETPHDHEPRRQRQREGAAADRSTEAGTAPRLPDGSTGLSSTASPIVAAPPSPPSTSVHPSDVARGPGDARPASSEASSPDPQGGRSPRPELEKVQRPPQEVAPPQSTSPSAADDGIRAPGVPAIRTSHAVTNPADKKIVREVAQELLEISTWTCPWCRVEMPLAKREVHRAEHESATSTTHVDRQRSSAGPAAPAPAAGSPAPPRAKQPDVGRVVHFVEMFAHGAKESADRRAYLAAAIKEAHRDQGIVISDADALELVAAIAARSPKIERALEPPESLDPHISKSTKSPTNKGGDRGRM